MAYYEEEFSDFASSSWGGGEEEYEHHEHEGGEDGADEGNFEVIELGGGIRLKISPELFRVIMHAPEIVNRVQARGDALASAANSLAIEDGAEYKFVLSTNPNNKRARGRVKPANPKGYEDDDRNATLLKALAQVGSDPHPVFGS